MGSLLGSETVAGVGDKAPAMNCLGCKRLALAGIGATGERFVQARQGADVSVRRSPHADLSLTGTRRALSRAIGPADFESLQRR